MGRRRRKVIRVVRKTLPKVFSCPNCGVSGVRVQIKGEHLALISCGNCKLKFNHEFTGRKEVIDIYNEFVDLFMAGKIKSEQQI
ncbi:MAG: hypothetical protein ACK4TI_01070 [Nitrososphaerales archaeon]